MPLQSCSKLEASIQTPPAYSGYLARRRILHLRFPCSVSALTHLQLGRRPLLPSSYKGVSGAISDLKYHPVSDYMFFFIGLSTRKNLLTCVDFFRFLAYTIDR
nr:MAG TPA: hypothetical protein [Caudoviricetes sp.]